MSLLHMLGHGSPGRFAVFDSLLEPLLRLVPKPAKPAVVPSDPVDADDDIEAVVLRHAVRAARYSYPRTYLSAASAVLLGPTRDGHLYISHAAQLVAACVACDESPEAARWLSAIRTKHRRFPALRGELDRVMGIA